MVFEVLPRQRCENKRVGLALCYIEMGHTHNTMSKYESVACCCRRGVGVWCT